MNNEKPTYLEQLINDAIKHRVEEATKEETEQALYRLQRRIPQIVSEVAMKLSKSYDAKCMNNVYTVTFNLSDFEQAKLEDKR